MISAKTKLLALVGSLTVASQALVGAVVVPGFDSTSFPGNDDGSVAVSFGLSGPLNFFGTSYSGAFLNNNGNITFASAMSTFTPFAITGTTSNPIIAPFFADVDTRSGNVTKYGNGTFEGHAAFGVTWDDVGYFAFGTDKLNSFQLLLVDRSDVGAGDFDIYFNYDKIQWETGGASGGSGGLGGNSARAGFSNGSGTFYEIAGSGVNGALLDSNGTTGLIHNSLNRPEDGRYLFTVRNGVVSTTVPDASATVGMLGLALSALAFLRRKVA